MNQISTIVVLLQIGIPLSFFLVMCFAHNVTEGEEIRDNTARAYAIGIGGLGIPILLVACFGPSVGFVANFLYVFIAMPIAMKTYFYPLIRKYEVRKKAVGPQTPITITSSPAQVIATSQDSYEALLPTLATKPDETVLSPALDVMTAHGVAVAGLAWNEKEIEGIVRQRLSLLPTDVVSAMASPHLAEQLRLIGYRHGLRGDHLADLEAQVRNFMLALAPLQILGAYLAKWFSLPPDIANRLAAEINLQIFGTIGQSLKTFVENFCRTTGYGPYIIGIENWVAVEDQPGEATQTAAIVSSRPKPNFVANKSFSFSAISQMNDVPRFKLRELMVTYGQSLCDDHRKCEALLRDLCGSHRREVNVLVHALKSRVVLDLNCWRTGLPIEVLNRRLVARLQDEHGLAEDIAQWAVHAWAFALGLDFMGDTDSIDEASANERRLVLNVRGGGPIDALIPISEDEADGVIRKANGGAPQDRAASPMSATAVPSKVLKSGIVEGMAYTIYVDGSIEALLPQGPVRFNSLADLRAHVENRG